MLSWWPLNDLNAYEALDDGIVCEFFRFDRAEIDSLSVVRWLLLVVLAHFGKYGWHMCWYHIHRSERSFFGVLFFSIWLCLPSGIVFEKITSCSWSALSSSSTLMSPHLPLVINSLYRMRYDRMRWIVVLVLVLALVLVLVLVGFVRQVLAPTELNRIDSIEWTKEPGWVKSRLTHSLIPDTIYQGHCGIMRELDEFGRVTFSTDGIKRVGHAIEAERREERRCGCGCECECE